MDLLKSDVELIDIELIKTAMQTKLEEVLASYSRFLKTGIVDIPLILDNSTNVLLSGYAAFHALELLSAKRVPALKVDINHVKIQPTPSNMEITKDIIIHAGVNGPKLPPNSFRLKLEPFKIKVPLKDLMAHVEKSKNVLKVFDSTLELLYENWPTPLVKLKSFSKANQSVWAKLESYNPFSNSIKDRVGWSMIVEAMRSGTLKKALYEATSTNTGIALTSIANILGIKSKLFIPEAIQKASDIYLDVLGADVVRLPVGLTVEALDKVDAEAKAHDAMHLNQFENDANFKVHLKYTAREIDEQLESLKLKPTCIIGGLGTSGHMSAISFYFKSKYGDSVKVVGVQPAPNEVIPGIRRVETGMKWYHMVRFDEVVDVTQSEAIEGAIKIARNEGLLIGLSAGAVVSAFQKIAKKPGVYVLIFPDSGYKYAEQFGEYLSIRH
ncbi:pyridoxal-phosphate dependent enzyme [Candidatus Bathyarchaeota archaeon]|nr:pyridoxal-phosphate dependent enzyme [Candidatus Bathyarchaeota archaeon]